MAIVYEKSFNIATGTEKKFSVTANILSKSHIAIWKTIDDVVTRLHSDEFILMKSLVILVNELPIGSVLSISVSDTGDDLDVAPTTLSEIYSMIDKIEEVTSEPLKTSILNAENNIEEIFAEKLDVYIEDVGEPTINNYIENTSKPSIDSYVTNTSKTSIDTYVNTISKPSIDEYVNTTIEPVLDDKVSDAEASASSAAQSAANASSSAISASESAGEAFISATSASVSASNALTSEENASISESNVATMKLAIETIYDTFDDRFLGAKTTEPTLDNDGNELVDGAMYFDTTSNVLKVYDLSNTNWVTIPQLYLSGLLDVALTSLTNGQVLRWTGSEWENFSIETEAMNLTNKTLDDYTNIIKSNATHSRVKNQSGVTLSKGTVVAYFGYSDTEDAIKVVKANNTTGVAIGILGDDILADDFGMMISGGIIDGLDTSSYSNGTILYTNATGGLTDVEPTTGFAQPIAYVLKSNATIGVLQVLASYPKQDASDVRYDATNSVYDMINNIGTQSDFEGILI